LGSEKYRLLVEFGLANCHDPISFGMIGFQTSHALKAENKQDSVGQASCIAHR